MKGKINVRYIDFTSARNGSRIFHFSVSAEGWIDAPASVEIPNEFLIGADRILFQDCAGISYAKLHHVMEVGVAQIPRRLRLTASDIAEFRKPSRVLAKGRPALGVQRRLL